MRSYCMSKRVILSFVFLASLLSRLCEAFGDSKRKGTATSSKRLRVIGTCAHAISKNKLIFSMMSSTNRIAHGHHRRHEEPFVVLQVW
jgi:hypothetical protein